MMSAKKYFFIKAIIIALIVPALSLFNINEVEAKAKSKAKVSNTKKGKKGKKGKKKRSRKISRHYNPEVTKQITLDIIKSNSPELSELIGISGEEENYDFKKEFNKTLKLADTKDIESIEDDEILVDQEKLDDEFVEDNEMDFDNFKSSWLSFVDDSPENDYYTSTGLNKKDIMDAIMQWVGTPYHFGGMTAKGIDCSAFTRSVFFTANDITLPRTAATQYNMGQEVKISNLQFGDLIFFHTARHAFVSHVGIYLGDGLFAHSGSKYGVSVASLATEYYTKKFIGARRLTPNDLVKLANGNSNKN